MCTVASATGLRDAESIIFNRGRSVASLTFTGVKAIYDSTPNKVQQNVCQVDNLCKIVVDNILKIDQNRNVACG